MKKVLILGAGVYQVPLILKAKEMGLYTIVVSRVGNYPGFEFADKCYYIDTTAKEEILEVAKENNIDAICTTGTDVAVRSIGYVNDAMGLSGISNTGAVRTTDKLEMQKYFHKGGVGSAEYRAVKTSEEAVAAATEIGYPVVVKCVDSSGSRGITTVSSDAETIDAFNEAKKYTRKDYVLVEEMLTGRELCVSGYIYDRKIAFLAPHNKHSVEKAGIPISIGHSFPYRATDEVISNIRKELQLTADALDLDNCAFNADAFDDNGKINIVEIGGRAGATCIPELIKMHYDVDYYKAVLLGALGEEVTFEESEGKRPCTARLLMSPVDGVLSEINFDGLREIEEEEVSISLDYKVGDAVEEMQNGTSRIGHMLIYTDDCSKVDEVESRIYEHIYLSGNSLRELWKR